MLFYNKKIWDRCFDWKGKYWYKNIKQIPLYFKLMNHLIKYGYDEYATWETFDWFIHTMRDVLASYRKNHKGYPCAFENEGITQEELEIQYDADIDKMISLLSAMDENDEQYDYVLEPPNSDKLEQSWEEQEKAKEEFFKLFSKHFYSLWD